MNTDQFTRAMTRDLGPKPVQVFATNAQGHTVAIAVSSPEALEELRSPGILITAQAPELRKAS